MLKRFLEQSAEGHKWIRNKHEVTEINTHHRALKIVLLLYSTDTCRVIK